MNVLKTESFFCFYCYLDSKEGRSDDKCVFEKAKQFICSVGQEFSSNLKT